MDKIFCPVCSKEIKPDADLPSQIMESIAEHLANEHRCLTDNLLNIFEGCKWDYGYFISCLKCEQENSERKFYAKLKK